MYILVRWSHGYSLGHLGFGSTEINNSVWKMRWQDIAVLQPQLSFLKIYSIYTISELCKLATPFDQKEAQLALISGEHH